MNRANDSHVPFPSYCRQRISSESIFKTNTGSRIAQERACDSMSRLKEDLSFAENSPLQQRLATDRSIRNSSNGENPGKILPASHPGSPAKRKSDTEDALAVVNRKGRPLLFITVTMGANWPEITSNLVLGQTAYDRPDLCCRVFKMKLKEIVAELKSGKVLVPYLAHLGVIEFQKRGYPHAQLVYTCKSEGPQHLNEMDK